MRSQSLDRDQRDSRANTSSRRSEPDERPRAHSFRHEEADRRYHRRSHDRERAVSPSARHSRDRTTRDQPRDRPQHRQQNRHIQASSTTHLRNDAHQGRPADLNGQNHAVPTQNGWEKPRQEKLTHPDIGRGRSQHASRNAFYGQDRQRDRSSDRDRTSFRPDKAYGRNLSEREPAHPPKQASQQYPPASAYQQYLPTQGAYGQYTHQISAAQPGQEGPAWPAQRQGNPVGSRGNPFKGRGKWKHDLFEELTQPEDEAGHTKSHASTGVNVGLHSAMAVATSAAEA